MPPMPPPGGMPPAPAPVFFFGTSATMASVVISSAATGRRVLDRHAHHLGRVDDALGDQVGVFAGLRIEAPGVLILLQDLADHHRAVFTGVDRDLAGRIGQRLAHDLDAGLLVVVLGAQSLEVLGGNATGRRAAGNVPSSTAARVACIASSTRSLRSLTSTSVAPPTRITATPPRAWPDAPAAFSRS